MLLSFKEIKNFPHDLSSSQDMLTVEAACTLKYEAGIKETDKLAKLGMWHWMRQGECHTNEVEDLLVKPKNALFLTVLQSHLP